MDTVVHMLSKPSLFHFFSLFAVFPLPALSYLPYLLSLSSPMRPLSSTDKENRGGGKKEQQQGGMRRERRCGEALRQRAGRLIWDDTHIRRHTGAIVWWFCCGALWSHRLSLMNVWPLFLPLSSPPDLSRGGGMAPGGIENLTPTFFGGPITTVSDVKVVSIDWHTDLGEAQRKLVKFKCKTSLLNLTRGI